MNGFVDFNCVKGKENFIYNFPDGKKEKIQIQIWKDSKYDKEGTLGSCFCSILNSKNNVLNVKKIFNNTYPKMELIKEHFMSDIIKIIKFGCDLLTYINPYFIVVYDDLYHKAFEPLDKVINIKMTDIHNRNYKLDIEQLRKEVATKINEIYDGIIETINIYDKIYSNEAVIEKICLPTFEIKSVDGIITNKIGLYSYKINNLDELMVVSFFLLNINNYHIRKCKCSDCNKYFSSPLGQTRYCNNPSPYNNTVPCIKIRKISKMENNHLEKWQIELDNIEEDVRNSRQFLYDHKKASTNKREKKMLETNHKKFLAQVKHFKQIIKAATDEEIRQKYLKNYKSFIDEVRTNQHSNPPIFRVKMPKF